MENRNDNQLKLFRKKMDAIDEKLAILLVERMELSQKIAGYKQKIKLPLRDKKRESELLDMWVKNIDDSEIRKEIVKIFKSILSSSRCLQKKNLK